MEIVNLTPHPIVITDGKTYPPSGQVARVSTQYGVAVNGVADVSFGEIQGLPDPQPDTIYIVSAMLVAAAPHRTDLVSPASGHPLCVRKDGQVVSVPFLVRNTR